MNTADPSLMCPDVCGLFVDGTAIHCIGDPSILRTEVAPNSECHLHFPPALSIKSNKFFFNPPNEICLLQVSYYVDQSSVSGDPMRQVKSVERHSWQWGMGYGTDSGGGDTVALLK